MFLVFLIPMLLGIFCGYLFVYGSMVRFRWSKNDMCFYHEALKWWEHFLYYSTMSISTFGMLVLYLGNDDKYVGIYLPVLFLCYGQSRTRLLLY